MGPPEPCPRETTFEEHDSGALSAAARIALFAHADQCTTCARRLQGPGAVAAGETVATARVAPLPAEPEAKLERGMTVGRYVVLDALGEGGMGVVYRAYDPELNRPIALKLLQLARLSGESEGSQRTRLLREGQALAKLSHPNIVPIFDVGIHDGAVFLAMELVEGKTLKAWLKETPRPWREVVKTFLDAGRGLAAVHEANLLHRDFKPANVLLGNDGRVRLLDFGIARANGPALPLTDKETSSRSTSSGSGSGDLLESSLTTAGSIVGTPSYMAPEQLQGKGLDARADQYSFCVSLFEGLCGRRPFSSSSVIELVAQIRSGRPSFPSGTRLPAWLVKVLMRGLAYERDARYPSMQQFLRALEDDPGPRRQRWVVGMAAAAALAIGGAGVAREATRRSQQCSGGAARLAKVWSTEVQERVRAAFVATGRNFAAKTWERVKDGVDAYGASWNAMYTESCEATRKRNEQPESVMLARLSCLEDELKAVQELTNVFAEANVTTLEKASTAVSRLPSVSSCANVRALTAMAPPPTGPDVERRLESTRLQLARGRALVNAGRYQDAVPVAEASLLEAQAVGYLPVLADALLLRADVLSGVDAYEPATADYRRAISVADEGRHDVTRARALRQLMFTVSNRMGNLIGADQLAPLVEGAANRSGDDRAVADYLEAMAALRGDQRRHKDAVQFLLRAGAIFERLDGKESLRRAMSMYNMGLFVDTVDGPKAALAMLSEALALEEKLVGPEHPMLSLVHGAIAEALIDLGRTDESLASFERGKAILVNAGKGESKWLAILENNLAITLNRMGEFEKAAAGFQRAMLLHQKLSGPDTAHAGASADGLGTSLRELGRADEAHRYFQRGIAIFEKSGGLDHQDLGSLFANEADLYLRQRQLSRARALLERTLPIAEKDEEVDHRLLRICLNSLGELSLLEGNRGQALSHLRRALSLPAGSDPLKITPVTHSLLARALWDQPGARDEARQLAVQAKAELRQQPKVFARLLAELDAWARARGLAL